MSVPRQCHGLGAPNASREHRKATSLTERSLPLGRRQKIKEVLRGLTPSSTAPETANASESISAAGVA